MPGFTVFDAETGEVLRSGICSPRDIGNQSNAPNEIVMDGQFSDDEYKMVVTEKGMSPRKKMRKASARRDLTAP